MEKHHCFSGTNANLVSSPMPIIGLYITTSTLVCLSLISHDVFTAFHSRKPWIPCKFFSLNSLTLTFLGVSTKLSVDLTSSMPSALDQLSKLCSTIFITISMGFFANSLADMEGFELIGNMASLTIFVVTVMVNVGIQIGTGVVSSLFLVEHVITLSLMLLTLVAMIYASVIKEKLVNVFTTVRHFPESLRDEDSMEWLRETYKYAYMKNPQAFCFLCSSSSFYIGMLCIISVGVLVEACFRVFFTDKFVSCDEKSDYKWSMWLVVASQIPTLVLGGLAISFRTFFLPLRYNMDALMNNSSVLGFSTFWKSSLARSWVSMFYYLPSSFSRTGIRKFLLVLYYAAVFVLYVQYVIGTWTGRAIASLGYTIRKFCASVEEITILDYLRSSIVKQMEKKAKQSTSDPPKHLIKILSDTPQFDLVNIHEDLSRVCLFLVKLVKLATLSLPANAAESLDNAMEEVFEIFDFIADCIPSGESNRNLAKELWMTRNSGYHWYYKEIYDLHISKDKLFNNFFSGDSSQPPDSGIELSRKFNKLFIGVIYRYLPQLPVQILEYVSRCSDSDFEERAEIGYKLMLKLEPLKHHVPWAMFVEATKPSGKECVSSLFQEEHGEQSDIP